MPESNNVNHLVALVVHQQISQPKPSTKTWPAKNFASLPNRKKLP